VPGVAVNRFAILQRATSVQPLCVGNALDTALHAAIIQPKKYSKYKRQSQSKITEIKRFSDKKRIS
jgi:hypothetical protein